MTSQPSGHLAKHKPSSTMSQSSYISRRSSSRLGDYAEFVSQQDTTSKTEATSTTMLTATSRVSSAKVLELANTNDMLEERMSSYQVLVLPFFFFSFCLSLKIDDNILFILLVKT